MEEVNKALVVGIVLVLLGSTLILYALFLMDSYQNEGYNTNFPLPDTGNKWGNVMKSTNPVNYKPSYNKMHIWPDSTGPAQLGLYPGPIYNLQFKKLIPVLK